MTLELSVRLSSVDCGNTSITLTPGTPVNLSSPLYPNPYAINTICAWTTLAPEGYKVQVDFLDFDIISRFDFVIFRDAPGPTYFSGDGTVIELPSKFTSVSENLMIQFFGSTWRDRTIRGFLFQLSAVNVSGRVAFLFSYEYGSCFSWFLYKAIWQS